MTAAIIAHMREDAEDPGFLLLVKYPDIMPFGNAVTLLLNSPQSALVCNLPEKWVQLFALDQQEELAALSTPAKEEEEEDEEEKKFKAMLSGFSTSLGSLASLLAKAEKGKAKAKETMLAKAVMRHLNNGMDKTSPATRACRRPMKEDSCNAGWMPEETLCMLCCKHAIVKDGKVHHNKKALQHSLSACLAKAMALPPVSVEDLFLLETPEPKPIEKPTEKPAKKKKQKPVHSYMLVKPKKHEQEDNKDLVGLSLKWSRLLEAEVKLLVMPLRMAEHKMLKLRKSLQIAQKAVDTVQKVVNTAMGWADQVQTLLGKALTE
ncbi:hypothetical protein DACRYDRAFT_106131 [Dacryopinax primogenitus]|uniref:Uncharacterized protein n=1 Tax=Dacryopinax primogenitus (strain DJM 731) TaxID=1858805 RepID=M5GE40_DACPD|nr:uncharacterized protein DACRYDRAFT_106131 [Dacryopinax primogenitus]EJU02953.1 hypothetical protein DACRYDRAFT_106131 [Dacryopinax primogenitus]